LKGQHKTAIVKNKIQNSDHQNNDYNEEVSINEGISFLFMSGFRVVYYVHIIISFHHLSDSLITMSMIS